MKQIQAIPKGIFDVHFSNEKFKYYDYACFLSIVDPDNQEQKYDLSINNFLQVNMWDVETDVFENGELKHEKPSDNELLKIIDFVNMHNGKSVFMIHCSAGISRSGAVAIFIRDKFYDETDLERFNLENKNIQPNLYILKRLRELDATP